MVGGPWEEAPLPASVPPAPEPAPCLSVQEAGPEATAGLGRCLPASRSTVHIKASREGRAGLLDGMPSSAVQGQ